MRDIIHLLPDSIANQIAAGEVVQRPSSVVKELIENSIDAGAENIHVIIREAGRALIQVIDDGIGMSMTDARMSFERHATSKITNADDLFRIRTMGFRGEALASIAAVAQVELKTKRKEDELGTRICIEGSRFIRQEPEACRTGASVEVKNLFFNVPARRNFLKSNSVEMRHVIDEFQRTALSHPHISFKLHQNDMEVYQLPASKLVKRIINLFGRNYQEQLVVCQEDTPHLKITGYVGKPGFAKKTRGEQFIFVNERYIRSNYLVHAIQNAYENLIPQEYFPFFVIFLEIDPKHIDVNVHPTKTEIKFVDERTIYGLVRATVKQSLGQHNITPSLDFSYDINLDLQKKFGGEQSEKTSRDLDYERFRTGSGQNRDFRHWEKLYEDQNLEVPQEFRFDRENTSNRSDEMILPSNFSKFPPGEPVSPVHTGDYLPFTYQLHNRYILTQVKSGLMMIDQVAAHQRILFEKYLSHLQNHTATIQKLLFPISVELNPGDYSLVMDIRNEITSLGFDFELFGKNAIIINGVPSGFKDINEKEVFEGLIDQYKHNQEKLEIKTHENLAMSMARYTCVREGKIMDEKERKSLIDQLFACKNPNYSPFGELTFYIFTIAQLAGHFKK
ncbi:MAG: DNA mismatch repair endonuclease MutL [Cyclobacteriaceae bacterium]|nr:DNA mismatch repair endonuclease MutL [Cyclobacteriaceae bacterium]